jgi:hypothetical protein
MFMNRISKALAAVLICSIPVAAACAGSAAQDITKMLAVTDVKTGYWDEGVESGKNKIVPTVILTLKNVSTEPINLVQLNAVVRRVGEPEEWGGAYVKVIGSEELPPGASPKPVVLRSNLGYTSTEPRAQILKNRQFLDTNVQVFVKHGGDQWVKLGEWPVARELLTQ